MESRTDIEANARRWIVLAAYMLVTLACEIQWLAHASVARAANAFYAGQFDPASIFNIDALALTYMLVYLVLCIPASRIIDSKGIRVGLGVGSALLILGSAAKAVGSKSFVFQLAGQLVLAASQPFIINGTTALSVRWFPLRERGLAAGLASLAQYLGFIIALGVTPLMVVVDPALPGYGSGIDRALWAYGLFSVIAGIAALILIKENPAYSAADRGAAGAGSRDSILKSYKAIFSRPDMVRTLLLFLIGLGVMNALTSMTDSVAGAIGAKDSDGLVGVAMILGGVIGAVVIPALSDTYRRRKPFIVLCAALMIPGVAGLAFVKHANPYGYAWKVAEAPDGAVAIRQDIPHPMFSPKVAGRYVFDFALSAKKDGAELERHQVTIDAKAGQVVLLDGTMRDDGIIAAIYAAALAAAFVFGFAVMSAGPLGFQYAAEVSYPAPEAASQGALLLVGQVSGIVFTAGMSMRKNLYLDSFLIAFVLLSVVMLFLATRLGESPLIITEAEKYSSSENIS